jgi:hypothetical protein
MVDHSWRNALIGWTRTACQAGARAAQNANKSKPSAGATKLAASPGFTS